VNPFIETYTGITFAPLDPVAADIHVEDIAHALANQCRYTGHCRFRYSVAEHSVRVSEYLEERGASYLVKLWGLLHDASEAYLQDFVTPLKLSPEMGPLYRAAEAKLQVAVCRRFALPELEPAAVRVADKRLLATEVRDLMHGDRDYWNKIEAQPLPGRIRPWGEGVAEFEFLRRYRTLTGDFRAVRKVG
jgi:hypothetical protein